MAYEQKPNSWVLFLNTKKPKGEAPDKGHPSYTGHGTVEVNGFDVEVRMAAWKRKSKAGTAYLSGKFEFEDKGGSRKSEAAEEASDD